MNLFAAISRCCLYAFLVSEGFAKDYTVQAEPFETHLSLEATFLPNQVFPIEIRPEEWSQYRITKLARHGSVVKKGEVILQCDDRDYLRELKEREESRKSKKIALAKLQRELIELESVTVKRLKKAETDLEFKKQELAQFDQIGRNLEEKRVKEGLLRSERGLEYTEEELKQLLKMYEEDGVTEETEEIILKRQKAAVQSAKVSLERTRENTKWALEKTIPRNRERLAYELEMEILKYETSSQNLPRTLEEKRLQVAKAERENQYQDQKLTEFKNDQQFFRLEAPADGILVYGEMVDGRWKTEGLAKFLFVDGKLPARKVFLTLVPAESALTLNAFVEQKQSLQLKKGQTGSLAVEGLEGEYETLIHSLERYPLTNGRYRILLDVTLPEDSPLVFGMKGKVKMTTYQNAEALLVPAKALKEHEGETTVQIKLADGKHEARKVKVGKKSGGKVEVLEGLSAGQVIMIPDEEKS